MEPIRESTANTPGSQPVSFRPGALLYEADLEVEEGWSAYLEVDGGEAPEGEDGVPVKAFNADHPDGVYDELGGEELTSVPLTPEQFAKARQWHWPDLAQFVWSARERQIRLLEDLGGGFDNPMVEMWEEYGMKDFCQETLRQTVHELLNADHPPIPVLNAYCCQLGLYQVWCRYCETWHQHGAGAGQQVAPCMKENSPYRWTGYILVPVA